MPFRLVVLMIVSIVSSTPATAIPSLEQLDISLQGEAKGWLNATCTYYGLGWLDGEDARQALTRLMKLINANHLGAAQAEQAKTAALERDPGCQAIWPETGE